MKPALPDTTSPSHAKSATASGSQNPLRALSSLCILAFTRQVSTRSCRGSSRLSAVTALLALALVAPAALAQRPAVEGRKGMVVSVHELGSRAGVEILEKGGNAVDAAIATGFALASVYPSAGNLGGGGFMVGHLEKAGTQFGIDYREAAPRAAHRDMYLDANGNVKTGIDSALLGWRASGVPGTVAAFAVAFEKYGSGKVTWSELIEPARKLAEGHVLTARAAALLRSQVNMLSHFPESRRIFLNNGKYFEAGEVWKQPELAATFARLQKGGPREFYEGETARLIARAMQENGGTIALQDLRDYRAIERTLLRQQYRGHEIVAMPPPCSGGVTLFQMLAMIEPFDVRAMGHDSAAKYHLFHEVMRRAFCDRIEYIGDPGFVNVPVARMLDRNYLAGRMRDFDPLRATKSSTVKPGLGPQESLETTHFSVVDGEGNAISNTYTLRNSFGSGVTIPGTGILMNNVMDDMAGKVGVPNAHGLMQGPANAIEPGKRPISSMTPVIVFRDGKVRLVTGSPGGPTIINTVFQVVSNVIDFDMPVMQAVEAPRVHHQWMPDEMTYEPWGMSQDTIKLMTEKGHTMKRLGRRQGDAASIAIDSTTGLRQGAADPRQADATALGY